MVNVVKTIETDRAPAAIGPYSQAKIVEGMLYASGQIPLDPVTEKVAGDGIEEQTEQIMKNISAILEAAETDFDSVVKTTCFLKDMSDFSVFNGIYEKYFTGRPARSCVAVKQLPKDVLAEVEFVAVCKGGEG